MERETAAIPSSMLAFRVISIVFFVFFHDKVIAYRILCAGSPLVGRARTIARTMTLKWDGPIDYVNPYHIEPCAVDIDATEIDDEYVRDVSNRLDELTSTGATASPTYPIRGQLFSVRKRVFFPMTVSKGDKSVSIPMLFDAGSPYTFLRKETFQALGITRDVAPNFGETVRIHTHGDMMVFPSHGRFEKVDLLGQDFLSDNGLVASIASSFLRAKLDIAKKSDFDW